MQHLLHSVYIQNPLIGKLKCETSLRKLSHFKSNGKYIKKTSAYRVDLVGLFEGKRIGRTRNLENYERNQKAYLRYKKRVCKIEEARFNTLVDLKKQTQKDLIEELQAQI